MVVERRFSVMFLSALPFLALATVAPRPLHDVPGHEAIGVVLFAAALVALWRLARTALARDTPARTLALAGVLLIAPWVLVALLWTGLGAPFQASAPENQQRYVLLCVNALLVGAGFMLLRDALQDLGERFFGGAMFAAAVPASGLYLTCIAITVAQQSMVVQGDHAPFPPVLSHLYDALEFFACTLTYLATALAAVATGKAGLLGRTAVRVFAALCILALVLLVLRGIEFPDISGHAAPWYTQPGVIVRIPAMPWVMPGILAAFLLRGAARRVAPQAS